MARAHGVEECREIGDRLLEPVAAHLLVEAEGLVRQNRGVGGCDPFPLDALHHEGELPGHETPQVLLGVRARTTLSVQVRTGIALARAKIMKFNIFSSNTSIEHSRMQRARAPAPP